MSARSVRGAFLTLLFVFAGAAPLVAAVEVAATGISVPFFNAAGKLTHRMMARTGTKSGNVQKLRGVEIHYFSLTDPKLIVQKLEAAQATWDDRKETLVGDGPVVVATEENRLTGDGFDFALATSLLHIHRNFRMENSDVIVTSDRATVELIVERAGENVKVRDVRRCDAIGNLHVLVQPAAQKNYRFKEAFSDLASYDGLTRIVLLPHPTRTIQLDGGEGRFRTLTIDLKDQAKK